MNGRVDPSLEAFGERRAPHLLACPNVDSAESQPDAARVEILGQLDN